MMSCGKMFSHSGAGSRVDDESSEWRWVRMSRYKECLLASNSPSTLQLIHHASLSIFVHPTQLPDCSWEPLGSLSLHRGGFPLEQLPRSHQRLLPFGVVRLLYRPSTR